MGFIWEDISKRRQEDHQERSYRDGRIVREGGREGVTRGKLDGDLEQVVLQHDESAMILN